MGAAEQARGAGYGIDELGLLIDGASSYAIYMLDPEGRVTIWNKAAEQIKGWSEQEILGKHYSLFFPPEELFHRGCRPVNRY